MRKTTNIVIDMIIIITLALLAIKYTSPVNASRDALIMSYDTIYNSPVDSCLKIRQVYINDDVNRTETYILYELRQDSVIKKYQWVDKY